MQFKIPDAYSIFKYTYSYPLGKTRNKDLDEKNKKGERVGEKMNLKRRGGGLWNRTMYTPV